MKALIDAELFRQIEHDRRRVARERNERRTLDTVVISQAAPEQRGSTAGIFGLLAFRRGGLTPTATRVR